jgi:hypothetical protein
MSEYLIDQIEPAPSSPSGWGPKSSAAAGRRRQADHEHVGGGRLDGEVVGHDHQNPHHLNVVADRIAQETAREGGPSTHRCSS